MALSSPFEIKDARDQETNQFLSSFRNENQKRYQISTYTYPVDVGGNEVEHFVSFFINIRGESKFKNQASDQFGANQILEDVKVGVGQNRLDPNKTSQATTAGLGIAGFQALGGGSLLAQITKGSNLAGAFTSLAKGVAGGVAGAFASEALQDVGVLNADIPKRISDVITLNIQDKPSTNYTVNYQEDKLGAVGGILAGGSSAAQGIETLKDFGTEAGRGAIQAFVGAVTGAFGGPGGRLLQIGTKQVTNSFREQFFESVDFRNFNFRHTFMPRSRAEALNVRRILNLFKFHMHPELSAAGLFYLYPSEFEIRYFFKNGENTYFDKISTCVLKNMNVDYGGDIFSSFDDGIPVEINLTLQFQELELLTKERIAQGY